MTSLAVNLPIYLLARAIAGLGAGIFSPMAVSTGSQLVENKNRGKALATVVGGMSIGTVIRGTFRYPNIKFKLLESHFIIYCLNKYPNVCTYSYSL